jgi:hypothetical protein
MLAADDDRQFGRSFMYNKNNNGPRFETCGTPHLTILLLDNVWLTWHI